MEIKHLPSFSSTHDQSAMLLHVVTLTLLRSAELESSVKIQPQSAKALPFSTILVYQS